MTIHVSVESKRGCGYRKPGKRGFGIYLVGPETAVACGRPMQPFTVCPACSCGVKPTRAWTWIEPLKLFGAGSCDFLGCSNCFFGMGMPQGRHGLLWVGEAHYGTPGEFNAEAHRMGVSRKLGALPRGFELGVTIVYLAHRKAIKTAETDEEGNPVFLPAVFSAFRPTGVDLVVDTEDESKVPEAAKNMAERLGENCRLVKVVRAEELPTPTPESDRRHLPIVL